MTFEDESRNLPRLGQQFSRSLGHVLWMGHNEMLIVNGDRFLKLKHPKRLTPASFLNRVALEAAGRFCVTALPQR